MSRKRKTKNQKNTKIVKATEKPEIVIREIELGGGAREGTEDIVEKLAEGAKVEGEASSEGEREVGEKMTGVDGRNGRSVETADEIEADEIGVNRNEVSEVEASEEVEDAGLTEGAKAERSRKQKIEKKPGKLGARIHRVNVYYPWLKFVVVLVLAVGMTLGGFGVGQVIGNVIRGANGSEHTEAIADDELEGAGQGAEIAEKPVEKPEEPSENQGEEGKPEEKPVVTPDKPTTNPPVTTPETNGKKLVALTFDDGPSPATTGRLLDILKAKGVKATFFVVGSMVDRAPDLLKREVAEGHEVGSHSSFHQNLSKMGAGDLQNETANMDRIFMEVLGRKVEIMRPPYGAVSDAMRSYLGKPMVNWSVDPLDWKYRNAATVRANVVGSTTDGAVVLMHDIHASTVDAVAGIIDDLRAQGYEFLTVSELAAARGVGLTSGVVYYRF